METSSYWVTENQRISKTDTEKYYSKGNKWGRGDKQTNKHILTNASSLSVFGEMSPGNFMMGDGISSLPGTSSESLKVGGGGAEAG